MKYIALSIIFLLNCTYLASQSNENQVTIGKKHTIESKILKENRNYYVYLPPSYKSSKTKKYIVVFS